MTAPRFGVRTANAIATRLRERGLYVKTTTNAHGDSHYIDVSTDEGRTFLLDVRVSDHEAPAFGGFVVGADGEGRQVGRAAVELDPAHDKSVDDVVREVLEYAKEWDDWTPETTVTAKDLSAFAARFGWKIVRRGAKYAVRAENVADPHQRAWTEAARWETRRAAVAGIREAVLYGALKGRGAPKRTVVDLGEAWPDPESRFVMTGFASGEVPEGHGPTAESISPEAATPRA